MKMRVKKLNEEIGFDYGKKPQQILEKQPETLKEEEFSFSLDSVEKSYKKIAKAAFEAGKTSDITFDDWWTKVWNTKSPKKEKMYPDRGKIGFGIPSTVQRKPQSVPVENIENRPRRVSPPKPPKPGQKPSIIPSPKPKRRGIWMDE